MYPAPVRLRGVSHWRHLVADMFVRCRSKLSGHVADIPQEALDAGNFPAWEPVKGAEPTEFVTGPEFAEPKPEKKES